MPFLNGPLIVEMVSEHNWRLCHRIVYRRPKTTQIIIAPAGFVTDFASIPHWTPLLFSILKEKGRRAAVIHDYLYRKTTVRKSECDRIFYEALRDEPDCPGWAAWMMYWGVRLFGFAAFNNDRDYTEDHR
jgi:hypothetical protein